MSFNAANLLELSFFQTFSHLNRNSLFFSTVQYFWDTPSVLPITFKIRTTIQLLLLDLYKNDENLGEISAFSQLAELVDFLTCVNSKENCCY